MRRVSISVPDDIPDMLEAVAGGERKKGEWLAKVVQAAYEGQEMPDSNEVEALRYQLVGVMAELNALKTRFASIEAKLAQSNSGDNVNE